MTIARVGLWVGTVVAAVIAGVTGGWMVDWAAGNTAVVEVDRCYVYYGSAEIAHTRCEGYWHKSASGGASREAVRGPVLGVHVDAQAPTVNDGEVRDFGYEVSYKPTKCLATLYGDAAIVIRRSHLILGPVSASILLLCGLVMLTLRVLKNRECDQR